MTISALSNISKSFRTTSEAPTPSNEEKKDDKKVEGSGFEELMRGIMGSDSAKETNEEELFAALIQERLTTQGGAEAAEAYATKLAEMKTKHTRADGYTFVEDAANEALNALVTDGTITQEIAGKVRSESFSAAQLDDNLNELWDGRGDANDPTIAVASMEAALISAREIINKLESGEMVADEAPASETGETEVVKAEGTALDGEGSGFLFKPDSESNGNLVVLLPAQMAQEVEKVLLRDKEGKEVENGTSSGYHNPDQHGDREHFRFTKPGASYPADLTVEVVMKDGSVKQYQIPDPSKRYD